jgi:hypothetical protein
VLQLIWLRAFPTTFFWFFLNLDNKTIFYLHSNTLHNSFIYRFLYQLNIISLQNISSYQCMRAHVFHKIQTQSPIKGKEMREKIKKIK